MIPNIVNMDAGKACGLARQIESLGSVFTTGPATGNPPNFLIVPCIGEQAMYMSIYIE